MWCSSGLLPAMCQRTQKKNQRGKNRRMVMMGKKELLYCTTKGGIKLWEVTNGREKVNRALLFIVTSNVRIRGQVKLTDVKLKPNKSRWFFKYSKLKTLFHRMLWMLKCIWVWQARQISARKLSERLLYREILLLIKNFQLLSAGKC